MKVSNGSQLYICDRSKVKRARTCQMLYLDLSIMMVITMVIGMISYKWNKTSALRELNDFILEAIVSARSPTISEQQKCPARSQLRRKRLHMTDQFFDGWHSINGRKLRTSRTHKKVLHIKGHHVARDDAHVPPNTQDAPIEQTVSNW